MGSFLWTQFIPLSVGGKELVRSQEADKTPVGLTTDFIHASGRQLAAGLDSLHSLNVWSLPPHFLHSIHRLLLGCHLRSGVGSAGTFVWRSQCSGVDTVGANVPPTKRGADFFKFINLFIFGCAGSSLLHVGSLWLWWTGPALHFSAWTAHCSDFSCHGGQALAVRRSVVEAHGLSCPAARGIFLDQGLNLCPLHWQVQSYPLYHQQSTEQMFKSFCHSSYQQLILGAIL